MARLKRCSPLRCRRAWLERFMSLREFAVAWDGKVKGRGAPTQGMPQGSLLSPMLFLVYMAPILDKMKWHVQEEVGRVAAHFPP